MRPRRGCRRDWLLWHVGSPGGFPLLSKQKESLRCRAHYFHLVLVQRRQHLSEPRWKRCRTLGMREGDSVGGAPVPGGDQHLVEWHPKRLSDVAA